MFSSSVLDEFIRLEDVVADLLSPFGRFAGAELVDTFGFLFELELSKFSAEDFESFFLVLELRTFVLDCDDDIGREMSNADGGVRCVDGLTTMTAGVIDVDTEVFIVDDDFIVVVDNREDLDEGEGSLAKIVGVKGGEADEAMDAMFGF